MSKLLYTSSAQPLRLGPPLGAGGAGTVYEVQNAPGLVAKLYHEPLTPERAEKLNLLARLGNERLFKLTAWPTDVLRAQPGGPVTGFTMPHVGQAEEVHALHSPKSRLQKFPDASWAFLLYVAANIARAVAVVHEHGFIVGDLNPKNILVTRQATVCLLDCDSFQIEAEGRVWRCEQGFPEYTPPELQGVAFRDVDRSAAHDAFGLAVVIFQLLFVGRHPFSGKFTGAGELPLERAIRELRFAYGRDAATRQMQPPPGTLALEAVSEPMMALFRRAFLTAERPQPREWIEALEAQAQTLQRCAAHSGHQFYQELDACPWCEIERRARTRLFNFALNGKSQAASHFPLTDIWAEIENVEPPAVPPLPVRQALVPQPSEEALAAARKHRASYHLALLFVLVAGWASAALFKIPLALILLVAAAKLAQLIAEAEPDMPWVTQTIFWQQPASVASAHTREFAQQREYAEAEYRHLSERWQQEATDQPFQARLKELAASKSAYELLQHHPSQWLNQHEERLKAEQLNRYLAQFEIGKDSPERDFIRYLSDGGINTAADITPQRLSKAVLVNHEQAQLLLNWRRELEQQFVFDAQRALPPSARRQLEQEWQARRAPLERELRDGAAHLRRFQAEISAKQVALHEPLLAAQTALAQAERDYVLVAERNPRLPLIILLILSFLFGSLWTAARHPLPAPPTVAETQERTLAEARRLYTQGTSYLNLKEFTAAIKLYKRALELDPQLAGAYQEMGYALYQLGDYPGAILASQNALRIAQLPQAHRTLGLVYKAQSNWRDAKSAFQNAMQRWYGLQNPDGWQLRYNWALCVVALGEAEPEIRRLRRQLAIKPIPDPYTKIVDVNELIVLEENRFDLAVLYQLTGRSSAAQPLVKILEAENGENAEEFRRLLNLPARTRN